MDFAKLKNKLIETKNKAVESSAKALWNSMFTIKSIEELNNTISKSKQTTFTNKETWETKTYIKNSFVLFWDENSDFFKESLITFPVLATKAFSQNITLKLAKTNIENLKLEDYNIKEIPSLVVFENEKVKTVIAWKENILKLVKSTNLDINGEIEKI